MAKQILVRVSSNFYKEIKEYSISKGYEDIQDLIRANLEKELEDYKIKKLSFFMKLKNLFF